MTKDVTPELLISAIRRVVNGALSLSPNVAESIAMRVAFQDDIAPLRKQLSRRELAVFGMLVDGETINDIARRLTLSAKTVSAVSDVPVFHTPWQPFARNRAFVTTTVKPIGRVG